MMTVGEKKRWVGVTSLQACQPASAPTDGRPNEKAKQEAPTGWSGRPVNRLARPF